MFDYSGMLQIRKMLIKVLGVLIFCLVLSKLWKNRRLYSFSWKLPGPIAFPFLGNAVELQMITDIGRFCINLKNMVDKYGSCFRVWLGSELSVVFSEAEDFECILQSKTTLTKGAKYRFLIPYVGNGLMTSSGQYYINHRHILNPSYNPENLKNHTRVHNEHAALMVEKMTSEVLDQKVDVGIYFLRYAAGSLLEYIVGVKEDFYEGHLDHILNLGTSSIKCFYERMCRPWFSSDLIYSFTPGGKETMRMSLVHDGFFNSKILQICESTINDTLDGTEKRLRTPVRVMLEAHRDGRMTKKNILDEFSSMYYPGADSIFTSLGFFVMMMATHKECQERAWREIVEVLGQDYDGPVLHEHVTKLKYLEMCFKEANRLYPTAPSLLRTADEDLHIRHRNLTIPKGTTVLLSVFAINRNPKYWKNPEIFDPDRFSPENSATRPNFSYVPFSAGLRTCIGKAFSIDCLMVGGVHLLRAMEFHSDFLEVPIKSDVSIRSSTGYRVYVTKRNSDYYNVL